jgi:hypothetical protein
MPPPVRPPFTVFRGWWADDVVDQHLGIVTYVPPRWGGQGERRAPRVNGVGSKTAARNTAKTITWKEETS